ncbi:MAG: SMC family ATPase [Dehalococcoidia bacterium]|nr:SMC family ATPase [Dehalococcoidia bacterium]
MIPLLLTVENFMCYGEDVPSLNLEPVHIACISGDNGYGKTALLDAITWAIWGKARAKTQDELVNVARNTMFVELDFFAGESRYRVTRTYTKGRGASSGKSELNLSIIIGNTVTSLMANTIRETEEKIVNLLNMDYEIFINTSYLKQGDSNRFTSSRPTDRKKILADLLDLSYYERLESASKQHSRQLQNDVEVQQSVIEHKSSTVQEKELILERLETYKKESQNLLSEEQSLSKELEDLNQKRQTLLVEISNKKTMVDQIDTSEKEIGMMLVQEMRWKKELGELKILLSRSEEIQSTYKEYQDLRSEYGRSSTLISDFHKINAEKIVIEKTIAIETLKLESQISIKSNRIKTDLQPLVDGIPKLLREINLANTALQNLEIEFSETENLLNKANAMSEKVTILQISNKTLLTQMSDSRNRFDMINHAEATCPLCLQSLSTGNKQHIREGLQSEGKTSKVEYESNLEKIQALTDRKNEIINQNELQQTILVRKKTETGKIQYDLMNQLGKSEDSSIELSSLKLNLVQMEEELNSERFCSEELNRLKILDSKLKKLEDTEKNHSHLESKLESLSPYLELHAQLQGSRDRLLSVTQSVEDTKSIREARQLQTETWKLELVRIEKILTEEWDFDQKINLIQSKIKKVKGQSLNAVTMREQARYQIEQIVKAEEDIKSMELEIFKTNENVQLYEELASAFGRNGIQALMIERAVPMLENTAKELLARLSDNKMTIKLELKEGRIDRATGLPSEELNITISDEQGTRSYETFSGGETFRIDFSIRIAMSKLLASRSGSPLPILFIDEGFGSQDTIGQGRLIEVIQSISEDFEKIIVITHVDSMKENFDQQIEISKTEYGSVFTLQ